jgi:hypothetical protein
MQQHTDVAVSAGLGTIVAIAANWFALFAGAATTPLGQVLTGAVTAGVSTIIGLLIKKAFYHFWPDPKRRRAGDTAE